MTLSESEDIRKVLYIDHTAQLGGGEIALLNLVRNLDLRRIRPLVLFFADGPLVEKMTPHAETHVLSLHPQVAQFSKDALGVRSLLKLRSAWRVIRHVIKVKRFAQNHCVELIHTNSLKSDVIGGLAARLAGIPVVWHVRDRLEGDYLPAVVVSTFRLLCRYLPTFVIANSIATYQSLHLTPKRSGIAWPPAASSRVAKVIHDGCEVDDCGSVPAPHSQHVRIGLIGRISPWKGQHIFIEAASLLHSLHPHARFEIVGAPLFAEQKYERHLHNLCEELNVAHVVTFAGFVHDISSRIASFDLVVHASTTAEPFGQVIIEGMANRKPIIATNGGGVPEIVQDGVTGLLVPMGDALAMANAIDYLLSNPDIARNMGLRGRERAIANFSIHKTAQNVEAVYQTVWGHA